ncbi:MAG: aminotransferase class III-fold pyridoxal phosphate-dependent enzyme, partial [Chloroflexota bacterium]
EKLQAAVTDQTAAIIVEAIQGEGGVKPSEAGYLAGLRELCDQHDILLIIDEVQTGFGRTGEWFACQHYGVVPDLLTMGKSIAGGVPMGAVGIGPRVQNLRPGLHGSTFGGNPLVCAAAMANLDAMLAEDIVGQSREKGALFLEKFRALNSPLVREVRGKGMMIGLELKTRVMPILKEVQANGVIAMPAGKTVLRLLPPAVMSHEEIETVVNVVANALEAVAA